MFCSNRLHQWQLIHVQVGYTIRFEDVSDKQRTRILYLTDGMLFRETLVDPLLSRYSVIMVGIFLVRVSQHLILIQCRKDRRSSRARCIHRSSSWHPQEVRVRQSH